MAQAVFDSCRELWPDIAERFLRDTIITMVNDFGLAQVAPNTNLVDVILPADVVQEFTNLVVDRILNNGYEHHVQQPPQPVFAAPLPVVPAARSVWADQVTYRNEAMALLSNEFKWFYQCAIQKAYNRYKNYTEARNFFHELIKPYCGDLNLETVDPLHPSYPMKWLMPYHRTERSIEHPTLGRYQLLQSSRMSRAMNVTNEELRAEIEAMCRLRESKDLLLAEEINFKEYENEAMLIACQCCFTETTFESLVACAEGHLFCLPCLKQYVSVKIEVGVKKGQLECMENSCDAGFPRSILTLRLEPEVLEKLDERITAYNLNASGMSDLVRCPKCQVQYQLEPNEKVLVCASCKFASCRRCHEPWDKDHIGKSCEEIEGKREIRLRQAYEEEMTKTMVRTCPKCKTEIVKTEGCNKVSCPCGGTVCYACHAPNIGYDHFCQHIRDPGRSCTQCKKCSLYADPTERDTETVTKLEAEAHKKQQEEHEARAKRLLEEKMNQPGPSGIQSADRKRSISSDSEISGPVKKFLSSLNIPDQQPNLVQ